VLRAASRRAAFDETTFVGRSALGGAGDCPGGTRSRLLCQRVKPPAVYQSALRGYVRHRLWCLGHPGHERFGGGGRLRCRARLLRRGTGSQPVDGQRAQPVVRCGGVRRGVWSGCRCSPLNRDRPTPPVEDARRSSGRIRQEGKPHVEERHRARTLPEARPDEHLSPRGGSDHPFGVMNQRVVGSSWQP
jgi:hypothetical protein